MSISFQEIEHLFAISSMLRESFQEVIISQVRVRLHNLNEEIDGYNFEIQDLENERAEINEQKLTKSRLKRREDISSDLLRLTLDRKGALDDRRDLTRILLAFVFIFDLTGENHRFLSELDAIIRGWRPRLTAVSGEQRVGRPPRKLEAVISKMKADIEVGKLSRDQLEDLPLNQLPDMYGVHRDTANRARQI